MDITETLDREVVVERAEAVRFWLLGFRLSGRAAGALQRELGAIIADDPGAYIDGKRPLAGLTVGDFVAELHRPSGGAVGQVKGVSQTMLNELRAVIPAASNGPRPAEAQNPPDLDHEYADLDYTIPELEPIVVQPAAQAEAGAPAQPDEAAETAPRRGRGRPKGSTKAARRAAELALAQAEPALASEPPEAPPAEEKRRRGRPRRVVAPLEPAASEGEQPGAIAAAIEEALSVAPPDDEAPEPLALPAGAAAMFRAVSQAVKTAREDEDPMLDQIIRLWPELHPHARRAVVMYVSELWVEVK